MDNQQEPSSSLRGPAARSCLACRRRKIKCDRNSPCAYCEKVGAQCLYPDSQMAFADPLQIPHPDILGRLARIERAVQRIEAATTGIKPTDATSQAPTNPVHTGSAPIHLNEEVEGDNNGKLETSQNRSRYLQNDFWNLVDLWDAVPQPDVEHSDTSVRLSTPGALPSNMDQHTSAFLFGLNHPPASLQELHPSAERSLLLWQLFSENVDPLLKIFHGPTLQRRFMQCSRNLYNISAEDECVLYSIYYAAIASTERDTVRLEEIPDSRDSLLSLYRYGVQQALARANFMESLDIAVLQSLTLYLICARRDSGSSCVWPLTGLAIRIATKIGLHRDLESLGLSFFETQIRRRLWWHIVTLDTLIAEENDTEPSLYEQQFNVKLPLNVNDSDIDPAMSDPLLEVRGKTDMMFCLLRFRITYAFRKLMFSNTFNQGNNYLVMTTNQKIELLKQLEQSLDATYFRHCDTKIPICHVSVTASRLIMTKAKVVIYGSSSVMGLLGSQEYRNELIGTCVNLLHAAHSFRAHTSYQRWIWLFHRFIEWDSVAVLLANAASHPYDDHSGIAWAATEQFFADWATYKFNDTLAKRWRQLNLLRTKVLALRQNTLAHQQTVETSDSFPDQPFSLQLQYAATDEGPIHSFNHTSQPSTIVKSHVPITVSDSTQNITPIWDPDPLLTSTMPSWNQNMDLDGVDFNLWL